MSDPDDETRTARNDGAEAGYDTTAVAQPHETPSGRRQAEERLAPGSKIGRYEVLEVLGSGGMGVVYRAKDPELGRTLAIKVVNPEVTGRKAQDRLLDEARIMARLKHPAVIPVFDVGTTQDGVFVVMPLVNGGTLHEWLQAEPRPWRVVLERFMNAGRGLAAAHAAGLVHRDFKPRNVLVGDGGEVMVADFGIAAATSDDDVGAVAAGGSTISGTPAYMAPEQARGDKVDARADQYSFCISVWEGLHGERPHDAETHTSGTSRARPRLPAGQPSTPAWLRAAIARGFAPNADERWPSLDALLAHLERRLRRPRRVAVALAALATAGTILASFTITRARAGDPCPAPDARLASAWSPSVKERVESAFLATKLPFAADTLERLVPLLDQYAREWRGAHITTCRATHVEHRQSAELLDRRMTCLDRRLSAFATTTTAMANANPSVVSRSVDAVAALTPVASCQDERRMLASQALPTSAAERRRIEDLEAKVDQLQEMNLKGEAVEFLARARDLAAATIDITYLPLRIEILLRLVDAERTNKADSEATLRELARVAAAAEDDMALAVAWSQLAYALPAKGRFDEATLLESVASAAVTRAGSPRSAVMNYETAAAILAINTGNGDTAVTHARAAVAAAETPLQKWNALANLGMMTTAIGDVSHGLELLEQARAIAQQAYGPRHPSYGDALHSLSQAMMRSPDASAIAKARTYNAQALEIAREAFGATHLSVAQRLITGAAISNSQADHASAEAAAAEAVAIVRTVQNREWLAVGLKTLADSTSYHRGFEAGKPIYQEALAAAATFSGTETSDFLATETNFAVDLQVNGDCVAARPHAEHAHAGFSRMKSPMVAIALSVLAHCDVADGDVDGAISKLDEAIEICTAGGCSTGNLEDLRFYEATVIAGRDRSRAIKLMREARDGFVTMGRSDDVAEADAWLKKHAR